MKLPVIDYDRDRLRRRLARPGRRTRSDPGRAEERGGGPRTRLLTREAGPRPTLTRRGRGARLPRPPGSSSAARCASTRTRARARHRGSTWRGRRGSIRTAPPGACTRIANEDVARAFRIHCLGTRVRLPQVVDGRVRRLGPRARARDRAQAPHPPRHLPLSGRE